MKNSMNIKNLSEVPAFTVFKNYSNRQETLQLNKLTNFLVPTTLTKTLIIVRSFLF
jgi:hypothetical protein